MITSSYHSFNVDDWRRNGEKKLKLNERRLTCKQYLLFNMQLKYKNWEWFVVVNAIYGVRCTCWCMQCTAWHVLWMWSRWMWTKTNFFFTLFLIRMSVLGERKICRKWVRTVSRAVRRSNRRIRLRLKATIRSYKTENHRNTRE